MQIAVYRLSVHVSYQHPGDPSGVEAGIGRAVDLLALDARPRHGYELASHRDTIGRPARVPVRFSLSPAVPPRGARWIKGTWVEKPDERRRRIYELTLKGDACWLTNGGRGPLSSRQWVASPETETLEFGAPHVRLRLSSVRLSPRGERETVDELLAAS